MFTDNFLQLGARKAKVLVMVLFLVVSFIYSNNVFAGDPEGVNKIIGGIDKANDNAELPKTTLTEQIGTIVGAALAFLAIVFFILIIYGGITWMIAQGNDQEVQKAKDTIKAAVIGLFIVLASYAITNYIGTELSAI